MNLRILKKLSKRAAPLLSAIGDGRKQFLAERDDNYMKTMIRDRKHWERDRSNNPEVFLPREEFKRPARDGNGWIYMHPPHHPRKGTVMVGGMSGGESPEWDEETAWCALLQTVYWSFVDIDGRTLKVTPTRPLRTPSEIFKAAAELAVETTAKRRKHEQWLKEAING